jgi:signal transduction histidine kinase
MKTTNNTFRNDVRSINSAKQLEAFVPEAEILAQKYLVSGDTVYYNLFLEKSRRIASLVDSLYDASPNVAEVGIIYALRHQIAWSQRDLEHNLSPANKRNESELVARREERSDSLGATNATLVALIRSNEDDVSNSFVGINAAMVRSTNVAWLVTVGALLVALSVALFITRNIVRPIRSLITGTENIARGVFDPIDVQSNDEMAWLADAVNEMSAKLKQINDLKTEMLHHISHELRSPLQTMMSAQYLLLDQRRGPLTDDQIKLVNSIKEGVKKLTLFSNQFLDIQKIEHGSMEYNFEPTDTLAVITSPVEDAQIVAAEKGVSLVFSHENDLPAIMTDGEKIAQVFSNLLSNAIKYTESGGTITVSVAKAKKGILASVADTGTGIPNDDLPRIFTKFYQAKNAKKGTGIGLALVKHLVEAHKGRVFVESELGKGTTFFVELPTAPARARKGIPHNVMSEGTV